MLLPHGQPVSAAAVPLFPAARTPHCLQVHLSPAFPAIATGLRDWLLDCIPKGSADLAARHEKQGM
jgi:hypothetical protein